MARRLLVGGTIAALLVSGYAAASASAGSRAGVVTVEKTALDDAFAAGADQLRNGGAEVGEPSGNGYDAVTIPGWQVGSGLPSVIRYGLAASPLPGRGASSAMEPAGVARARLTPVRQSPSGVPG